MRIHLHTRKLSPAAPLNILFVNYGDLRSNSMGHIAPYANALVQLGHSCAVAAEANDAIAPDPSRLRLFKSLTHGELEADKPLFPDGRHANIVHAWTPRESVRKLVQSYRRRHPQAKLVIHLEDNEESILESYYRRPIDELRQLPADKAPDWHQRLSHPVEYRRFLATADAVTLIAPSLYRFLPVPTEFLTLKPILGPRHEFSPEELRRARAALPLPPETKLVVYPGGITNSNWEDIRDLFLAAKLLQDSGRSVVVAKTGPSNPEFENAFSFPLSQVCLDLGYLPENQVAQLIACADVLVQPGKDNPFNRDRFPCKIPEFLASGRPAILPHFYLDDAEAPLSLKLLRSDPQEIAQQIQLLHDSPQLAQDLTRNAQAYAARAYAPAPNVERLHALYHRALANATQPPYATRLTPEDLAQQRDASRAQAQAAESLLLQAQQESATLQAALQAKILDLTAQATSLETELGEERRRLDRFRKTFSWQATSPLRALRRALVDPIARKAPPPPPPPSEPTPQLVEPSPEPLPEPPPHDSSKPPPGHHAYAKDYHKFLEREQWLTSIYLAQYQHPKPGPDSPKISILLPVYNIDEKWLRHCIDSVIRQVYQNWELCIADDASTASHIAPILEAYRAQDSRIRLTFRETNGHISHATNSAAQLATGDYFALLDHDDELPPHALARVAETISRHPHAKLIYSDEDKIDAHGFRHGPHFKSDWNYDLFLGCNMISHLGVYRRDAFEIAGGFRPGFEGAQDWDLALRVIETCSSQEIVHIPEILYHWRTIETSTAFDVSAKNYAHDAQRRALAEHLQRKQIEAELISISGIHWRVRYTVPSQQPAVTIVVPSKDRRDILEPCIESILTKTTYQNYQILVVDNQSTDEPTRSYLQKLTHNPKIRILDYPHPFNYSAINNRAIETADSEIVCLLNNDTEVIEQDWLSEMVSHAIRPAVGVVGAKLLYPDDHIQHAGVILGVGGVAAHAFKYLHKNDYGHVHRAYLVTQWSAVTGACMAFRKQVWEEAGGLDEANLAVSYNDVDFCLRVRQLGYTVVHTPYALLYHKEAATRASDQSYQQIANFHREAAYMHETWPHAIYRDPFYNPNFTKSKEDFSYAIHG